MIIGQWVNGRSAPGSGAMPLTAPQPATAPQLIQRTGQNWTFSSYISFLSSCSDIKQLDVVVFYFPSCNVLTSLLHAGFVFRWEVSVVFLLTYFGHWDISVICLTAVLKLAVTVLINLYFQVFWPKKNRLHVMFFVAVALQWLIFAQKIFARTWLIWPKTVFSTITRIHPLPSSHCSSDSVRWLPKARCCVTPIVLAATLRRRSCQATSSLERRQRSPLARPTASFWCRWLHPGT